MPCKPHLDLMDCHFYFVMIRPQPQSTLFPYTTLFRSTKAGLKCTSLEEKPKHEKPAEAAPAKKEKKERRRRLGRSEEHTSELQSLTNLVCRLLLEKKNNNKRP